MRAKKAANFPERMHKSYANAEIVCYNTSVITIDERHRGEKMQKAPNRKRVLDPVRFVLILGAALAISMLLAGFDNDNNPFAMGIFILAVAVVARFTDGYLWGIAASVVGTLCVNYCFTYPFWSFDITYPGYPLTVIVMLVVSVLVSTLTTQIKRQEHVRYEMERERMHANLLRAIAHDIRTPLASIVGASSTLLEQPLSRESQTSLLTGIHRDAEWLVRVTENLLSVTRFSTEEVRLKTEEEVLEEIIGSAILKYHRAPTALPVQVSTPDEILLVPMDGVLIEQVLINLFDNVNAHAKGATQIWLSVSSGAQEVTVSIEDDGPGIPASSLPQLLDGTMQQTARSRSDDRRNMGIGLSVCNSIIRAHGGRFSAGQSRHGGAAFRFTLPCKEEPYAEPTAL